MRLLNTLMAAAIALAAFSDRAEAQFITGENLYFVEELDGFEEDLSLCILHDSLTFLWIVGLWASNFEYVFADERCKHNSFNTASVYSVTEQDFLQLQQEGIIPAKYGYPPQMTPLLFLRSYWGLSIPLAIAALFLYARLAGASSDRKRQNKLDAALTKLGEEAKLIIKIMIAAVQYTGLENDNLAVQKMTELANRMSKDTVTEADIRLAIANTAYEKIDERIPKLSVRLDEKGKGLAIRGILITYASDGKLDQQELRDIGVIAGQMGLTQEQFDVIYKKFYQEYSEAQAKPQA